MTVYVDGRPYRFFPGAAVKDLVGRLDPATQVAVNNNLAAITDSWGNILGDEGALSEGAHYALIYFT